MRKILFRGFSPCDDGPEKIYINNEWITGKWVEGYYGEFHNRPTLDKPNSCQIFEPREDAYLCGSCIGGLWYIVIPETVSEFTGIYDKHNKMIWEHDVVKSQPHYDRPYSEKRKSKQFIGVVTYTTRTFGGNKVYPQQTYNAYWGITYHEDFGKYTHYSWGEFWNCEVVGNVWSNPELLEVTSKD